MTPMDSIFNESYIRSVNTIVGGDFGVCPLILPDSYNVGFGELGTAMTLSHWESAMNSFICPVVFSGIPTKIGKMIIESVSVVVTSLHSLGAWTHESQKNDAVNPEHFHDSANMEINMGISGGDFYGDYQSSAALMITRIYSVKGPDSSVVGGLVKSLVPRDIFPDFFHVSGIIA